MGACTGRGHMIPRTQSSGAETVWQTVQYFCSSLAGHPRTEGPSSLNVWEETPSTSCRMGKSRRKVISALCFLLLLLEVGSAKTIWKRALHTRLAEKSHVSVSAGVGRPGGDGQFPDTVHSVSTPPDAGRAGIFLYLRVSKSAGRQMELTPSKALFLEARSKERTKNVRGDRDMLCLPKRTFS